MKVFNHELLENLPGIGHGFFARLGGVSSGYYASLNLAKESKDLPENVQENQRRVLQYLNKPSAKLIIPHGNNSKQVAIIDDNWLAASAPLVDGAVTTSANIVLGSHSADCPIVLLADANAHVIGTAHAGWRGARVGIIEEVLKVMQSLGASLHNIHVVISPCISQESFEFGQDCYQLFIEDDPTNQRYFKPAKKHNHYLFDLRNYLKDRIKRNGVQKLGAVELDTYANEEYFFSYRRSIHRGDKDFGGHISCIYLK